MASSVKLSSRKRAGEASGTTDKKLKLSSGITCRLKHCKMSGMIDPKIHARAEMKASLSVTGSLQKFLSTSAVAWSETGEATLHRECWDTLLKESRKRNSRKIVIKMSPEEKSLVKEAAKTVESHDSLSSINDLSAKIVSLMKQASHCIVFTGAGISTSAGIGDYRGKEGKWTEMDRVAIAGEHSSTSETNEEVEDDGVEYEDLRPTYTHEALAKLLELGIVKYIISQNGDGLHGLSGISLESLAELHGNVFVEICEACGKRYQRPYYVMDDTASQYYEELEDNGETQIKKPPHAIKCMQCGLNHRTGRKCEVKGCKGYLKDSIINFGDNLEESILLGAEEQAKKSDLIVSLGTTMKVTPACDLVLMGKQPLRLVIVNRQKTGFDEVCGGVGGGEECGVRVFGDCDQVMRKVMEGFLGEVEREQWEKGRESRMMQYGKLRNN